jgi:MYXO-CTERM domain-containing protein
MTRTVAPFIVAALVLLAASGADARPARWHRHLAGPRLADARAIAEHLATVVRRDVTLAPDGVTRTWRGHTVARIAQEHEGLPVLGRGMVVRLDRAGRLATVLDDTAVGLTVPALPGVSEAEARAAADRFVGLPLARVAARLGVLDNGQGGALAWVVEGSLGLHRVRILVDAVTGAAMHRVEASRSATGRVFAANPVATPDPVWVDLPNLTGEGTRLTGRAGTVVHYVAGDTEEPTHLVTDQLAVSDGTTFDYAPHPDVVDFADPFVEVNLYYHVDRIDSYFRERHGFQPGRAVLVIANYQSPAGTPYDNAFSGGIDPDTHGLVFGQGRETDFGYDGDVVYHEYTHFVVDEVASLGYLDALFDTRGMHFAPGGIHEGLADYFSASLSDGSLSAEYALGSRARNLDNDRRCPDDVVGEPHDDGWIIGGTAWEIRQTLGASDLADAVVFGAALLMGSSPTYQDFAAALQEAAAALVDDGDLTPADAAAIDAVLDARGLSTCGREQSLDDGAEIVTHPFGFDWLGRVMNMECDSVRIFGVFLPSPFQYRITVPADARTLSVHVRQSPTEGLLWRLYLRREQPVTFSLARLIGGLKATFIEDFDHEYGDSESADATHVLTTEHDPPLVPGATYYVALAHQNCPDSETRISAATSPDLPAPDGGIDVHGGGSDGCGCAAAERGAAGWLLLLAMVWLALWRRREKVLR